MFNFTNIFKGRIKNLYTIFLALVAIQVKFFSFKKVMEEKSFKMQLLKQNSITCTFKMLVMPTAQKSYFRSLAISWIPWKRAKVLRNWCLSAWSFLEGDSWEALSNNVKINLYIFISLSFITNQAVGYTEQGVNCIWISTDQWKSRTQFLMSTRTLGALDH